MKSITLPAWLDFHRHCGMKNYEVIDEANPVKMLKLAFFLLFFMDQLCLLTTSKKNLNKFRFKFLLQ